MISSSITCHNCFDRLVRNTNAVQVYCVHYKLAVMKKIIDIVRLEEAKESLDLAIDYRMEHKRLKRYLSSLKVFRERIAANSAQISSMTNSLGLMKAAQTKPRSKESEVEYFMFNGVKVFTSLFLVFEKMASFYSMLHSRVAQSEAKIKACLSESKKRVSKSTELFEKEIKSFASECFPETNSLLFKIGFVEASKVSKRENSFRQNITVEQTNKHNALLKETLQKMEELKEEAMSLSRQYYEGARDLWATHLNEHVDEIMGYQTNNEEVERIALEMGPLTDRSQPSLPDEEG